MALLACVVLGVGCSDATSDDVPSVSSPVTLTGSTGEPAADADPRGLPAVPEPKDSSRGDVRRRRAEAGGPRIAVKGAKHHDFGRLVEGRAAEHTFVLTNKGEDTLVIQSVRTTCGCSRATLDRTELAPREKAGLTLRFESDGGIGEKQKSLRVYSNDPIRREVVLSFDVEVVRLLEFTPATIDVGEVPEGEGWGGQLEIRSVDGTPFRLTDVECRDPHLSFSFDPTAPATVGPITVRALLDRNAPIGWPGTSPTYVKLRFDHPEHAHLRIPVRGQVVGPLSIEPRILDFDVFEHDAATTRVLTVTALREERFAAPTVDVQTKANRSKPGVVQADVREEEPGRRWSVVVTVHAGFPFETLSGTLRVKLPTQPPTSVPVALLGTRGGR